MRATHAHTNTTTHMHMYRELGTKILYYIIRSNFLTCTYGTKLHITGSSVSLCVTQMQYLPFPLFINLPPAVRISLRSIVN